MYRTHAIFLTCLFALGLLLQGCIQRMGDFTALSGKNIDMQGGLHAVSERNRVEGTHWKFVVFPDLEEALDNAVEQYGGAVGLTNVVITLYNFPFYHAFYVEGDPVVEIGGSAEEAGADILLK